MSKAMAAQKKVDVLKVRDAVREELLDRMNYTGFSEEHEVENMLSLYFEEVVDRSNWLIEMHFRIKAEIIESNPSKMFEDHSVEIYSDERYVRARYNREYTKVIIAELHRIKFELEDNKWNQT